MRRLFVLLSSLALVAAALPAVGSTDEAESEGIRWVINYRGNTVPANAASAIEAAGGTVVQLMPQIGIAVATSEDSRFANRLSRDRHVQAIAEDILLRWIPGNLQTHLSEETPPGPAPTGHDPAAAALFFLQWNMRAIQADDAWAAGFQGDPAVTVAILDTGIDPSHIDMMGTVDAARSASFVTDLVGLPECSDPSLIDANFPGEPEWIDLHLHGTHVAGIVAAQGFGVSGVAPHTTLMAVKVLNVCGFGMFSWVIQGIVHAADQVADVINMSLGARFPRSCMFEDETRAELRDACAALLNALNRATNYAHRQGSLVISSAGNAATNADRNRDVVIVPAQSSNVVGVSATGPIDAIGVEPDTVASYTDFGHSLVDVAAPGGDFRRFTEDPEDPNFDTWFLDMVVSPCSRFSLLVPVCQTGNFFLFAAGTSMSAPHASGVAALIDSLHGGALNGSQLRAVLQQSADDLGKRGADPFYGHGRVNAFNAVE